MQGEGGERVREILRRVARYLGYLTEKTPFQFSSLLPYAVAFRSQHRMLIFSRTRTSYTQSLLDIEWPVIAYIWPAHVDGALTNIESPHDRILLAKTLFRD